jgi:hypothetical protein
MHIILISSDLFARSNLLLNYKVNFNSSSGLNEPLHWDRAFLGDLSLFSLLVIKRTKSSGNDNKKTQKQVGAPTVPSAVINCQLYYLSYYVF